MQRDLSRTRLYVGYFLAWITLGLVYLSQDVARQYYQGDPHPWRNTWYWIITILVCAVLTPVVLRLVEHWPIERPRLFARTGLHFAFSLVFTVAKSALGTCVYQVFPALYAPVAPMTATHEFALQLLYGAQNGVIAYWLVAVAQTAYRNYIRYQERTQEALRLELGAEQLRTQITHAQLNALKAQLQPHFLFNTLNAIMVLIRKNRVELAERTLERFGDMLRVVLADIDSQEVPLSKELEYAGLYLAIEQLRFSDRLRVSIDVQPELYEALVPHMCLQPILENAVRHGIEAKAGAGSLSITARRSDDQLYIVVSDDGLGFDAVRASQCKGIGISNTRARLRQLYGAAGNITIQPAEGGGAWVELEMPYRTTSPEGNHESR